MDSVWKIFEQKYDLISYEAVYETAPATLGLYKLDGVAPLIADPPPLKLH